MRSLLLRGATWITLIGLALTGYGLYEAFSQRHLSAEPEVIDIGSLQNYDGALKYVTISGGVLDLENSFEYTREKRGKVRSREFFAPVLNLEGMPVYIIQTDIELDYKQKGGVLKYTGLLDVSSGLPSKISEAYDAEFNGAQYYMLDQGFTFKTMGERFKTIGVFFLIFLLGLGLRKLLRPKPEPSAADAQPQEQSPG